MKGFRDIVQYVYYRFGKFYGKYESSGYEFSGFILFMFLFFLKFLIVINFLRVSYIGQYIDIFSVLDNFNNKSKPEKYLVALIFAVIFGTSLYFIIGRPTYERLHVRFNEEPMTQRKKRGWIIVSYIVLTISLFVFSIYVNQK